MYGQSLYGTFMWGGGEEAFILFVSLGLATGDFYFIKAAGEILKGLEG